MAKMVGKSTRALAEHVLALQTAADSANQAQSPPFPQAPRGASSRQAINLLGQKAFASKTFHSHDLLGLHGLSTARTGAGGRERAAGSLGVGALARCCSFDSKNIDIKIGIIT